METKANLYITDQGAYISKHSDALIVRKDDKELLEIECFKIDSLLIFGHVQFSTETLHELLEHGIGLSLFTRSGKFLGRLSGKLSNNSILRLQHHKLISDESYRLEFARQVVSAKIDNSLTAIDRMLESREAGQDPRLETLRNQWIGKASAAVSQESLLGIEGSFANMYFDELGKLIPEPFTWLGRHMHPSPDPVNALMSLTYTFITNRLQSLVEGAGLDPCLGFFHVADYSRPSLALDIIEPLRAPLCDRFVLTLLSKKMFKPGDFEDDDSGGKRLVYPAFRKYISAFEKEMSRNIRSGELDTTWTRILRDTVDSVRTSISDSSPVSLFRMPLR